MIKWITEFLGTAASDALTNTSNFHIVDARSLVDKAGNNINQIYALINEGCDALQLGKKVVICCDYGMSRSNSLAIGILAKHYNNDFNTARDIVLEATKEEGIKLEIYNSVQEAICGNQITDINSNTARILITGGSGFIGTSAREILSEKYFSISPSRKDIDLNTDLLKLDSIIKSNKINTLLHLANPKVYTTNASLGEALHQLKNVLNVCAENNLKLIYLSSWEVYSGYKANKIYADEQLPLLPKGTYGETKFLAESLLQHYKINHNLQIALLRPAPLYGLSSARPKFIYTFIEKALRNQVITTHRYLNGKPELDLLHVNDFLKLLPMIFDSNFTGCLNLGTMTTISTYDIAELIIKLTNSKSTIEEYFINSYVSNVAMDHRKAKSIFRWNHDISIQSGLLELIAKYAI